MCRQADKDKCQTLFTDDEPDLTLCCKTLHDQHCVDVQNPTVPSSFGVKQTCVLSDLQYFHVSENHTVDIMHDILEG